MAAKAACRRCNRKPLGCLYHVVGCRNRPAASHHAGPGRALGAVCPGGRAGGSRFWVATKEPAAVRTTKDVDLMVRREDLPRVRAGRCRPAWTIWKSWALACSSTETIRTLAMPSGLILGGREGPARV